MIVPLTKLKAIKTIFIYIIILIKKYYFSIYNETLLISSTIKKLLPFCKDLSLKNNTTKMYLDTGLIIPPFTHFKGIYRLPIFSKICKNLKNYEIKFDLFSEYKHKPFQSHKEFHKEIKKILNSFILRYKSKNCCFCKWWNRFFIFITSNIIVIKK